MILWSDSTGAQNRNKFMCAGIVTFLASATYIHTIEHKFLEAGHTFMEVDSIHSAIERETRHRELNSPSDIGVYIRSAKKTGEKDTKQAACRFSATAFAGISKIHHIVYKREQGGVKVWWKEMMGNFQDNPGDFDEVQYTKKTRRADDMKNMTFSGVFTEPLGVDKEKKRDLVKLSEYSSTCLQHPLRRASTCCQRPLYQCPENCQC